MDLITLYSFNESCRSKSPFSGLSVDLYHTLYTFAIAKIKVALMSLGNIEFTTAFSVDNVIFGFDDADLKILLIKRAEEPFANHWALPGALVYHDENLRDAPMRVLKELTGLNNVFLEQVKTFGKVNRHPSGRVITIAYYSLINIHKVAPQAMSFAEEVSWIKIKDVDTLAFDHKEILEYSLDKLRRDVKLRPIGFELLPDTFTLSQLQSLYEAVLDKELDKRNFRKKIISMKLLLDVKEYQQGVAHRPAKLFSFDPERYLTLKSEGFNFEI
jgi:8-oxo-dGTP diphosphatase